MDQITIGKAYRGIDSRRWLAPVRLRDPKNREYDCVVLARGHSRSQGKVGDLVTKGCAAACLGEERDLTPEENALVMAAMLGVKQETTNG